VKIKRSSANSGVEVAGGDAKQRKRTNCCIPHAGGESPKSVVPLRSGEVGIASIGRRRKRLHLRQKRKAAGCQYYCFECILLFCHFKFSLHGEFETTKTSPALSSKLDVATAALSTLALIISSHQLFRGQAHPSCETNFHQRYSAPSF